MDKILISLTAEHNMLSARNHWLGTSGQARSYWVSIDSMTADWDGLTLMAVFTDGTVTVDVTNIAAATEITVPHEVMTTAGRTVSVGLYGTDGTSVVLTTNMCRLCRIDSGAEPSGDSSTDPTLPVWAQIQSQIGDLSDLTTEDKTTLVGAINEAAESGGGSGASSWSDMSDKPFESIGDGLSVESGKLTAEVTAADLAAKQDKGDYATRTELTAHTSDTVVHVTATERAEWSGKQPAGDYATTAALSTHTGDSTIHVTSADKTRWDAKQDAGDYATTADIPTKTSELTNDSGYLTTLPTASATTLGGVKVGDGLAINDGVLSVSIASATGVTF